MHHVRHIIYEKVHAIDALERVKRRHENVQFPRTEVLVVENIIMHGLEYAPMRCEIAQSYPRIKLKGSCLADAHGDAKNRAVLFLLHGCEEVEEVRSCWQ